MKSNKEWLDELAATDPQALQAWFDAPRGGLDAPCADCGQVDGNHSKADSDDSDATQKEPVSLRDCFGILSDAPKCFEMLRNEQDSREQLERDIDVWLDSMTGWSIPARTIKQDIIAWLDRQEAITTRQLSDRQIMKECKDWKHWCKNAEKANRELHRQMENLQAENDALLAAHADDVERLDAMGEGKLLKRIDELKEELIAEREAVEACEGCELTDELRAEIAKRDKGIERLKARRDELQEEVEELKAELAIANAKLEGKPDCVPCDRTTLLTEVESLTAERDELKAKAEHYREHVDRLMEAIKRLTQKQPRTFDPEAPYECAELVGRYIDELKATSDGLYAENLKALAERDYWRQEVQFCMDAAYPPSHAPEKPYNPHVMDYPTSSEYTTPSTMVSAVIDGLRDEKMAEWKGVFDQLSNTETELERYRKLAGELLDAAHNMQLIADRGLA